MACDVRCRVTGADFGHQWNGCGNIRLVPRTRRPTGHRKPEVETLAEYEIALSFAGEQRYYVEKVSARAVHSRDPRFLRRFRGNQALGETLGHRTPGGIRGARLLGSDVHLGGLRREGVATA